MAELVPDLRAGTIKVGLFNHVIGNDHCNVCSGAYPKLCVCEGLIHRETEPEIKTQCDVCGPGYQERR